jgi:high-affinity iron transporter
MSYMMLFLLSLAVPNAIAAFKKRTPALWQHVEGIR